MGRKPRVKKRTVRVEAVAADGTPITATLVTRGMGDIGDWALRQKGRLIWLELQPVIVTGVSVLEEKPNG